MLDLVDLLRQELSDHVIDGLLHAHKSMNLHLGTDPSTLQWEHLPFFFWESKAFWVLIARDSAVIKAIDVMILSVVCKKFICPDFNPATGALA